MRRCFRDGFGHLFFGRIDTLEMSKQSKNRKKLLYYGLKYKLPNLGVDRIHQAKTPRGF